MDILDEEIDFATLDALEASWKASSNGARRPGQTKEGPRSCPPLRAAGTWSEPPPAAGFTAHPWPSVQTNERRSWPNPTPSATAVAVQRAWTKPGPLSTLNGRVVDAARAAALGNCAHSAPEQVVQSRAAQTSGPESNPSAIEGPPLQLAVDDFDDPSFDWAQLDFQCQSALEGPLRFQQLDPPEPPTTSSQDCQATGQQALDHDDAPNSAPAETKAALLAEPVLASCNTLNPGLQVHRRNAAKWVYPEQVPERKYQVEIIRTALLNNTLVCLPTGLGKTLIAAVVMHNFSRWFPQGKIVFVAPTKPLVNQQVEACQKFMGMHKADCLLIALLRNQITPMQSCFHEMTGMIEVEKRTELWAMGHKRIFFCTPQVFKNDICRGVCPAELITCIIVDECHKATGKNDIVLAIKKLAGDGLKFRVVGLSATPGRDRKSIQEVVSNLLITRIEVREENHPDVVRHVHPRHVEVIKVPLQSGDIAEVRNELLHFLRKVMGHLVALKAYYGDMDAARVSSYAFLMAKERYTGARDQEIQALFRQAQILANVRKLMDEFGIDSAYKSLSGTEQEGAMRRLFDDHGFLLMKKQLERLSRDASGHPKMKALQQAVLSHLGLPLDSELGSNEAIGGLPKRMRSGRVIIFSSLRESVYEIIGMLNKHEPYIKARTFIGQGKGGRSGAGGISQKEQQKVLADFREGSFNVLVATCIGEEGLDICQVEKVICFDAFQSPIRNIQRMGRTGRHEAGHVVHIISEGAEEGKYNNNLQNVASLYKMLQRQDFDLHTPNPRMLPREFMPAQLNVDCKPDDIPSIASNVTLSRKQTKAPSGKAKKNGQGGKGRSQAAAPKPGEGSVGGYAAIAAAKRRRPAPKATETGTNGALRASSCRVSHTPSSDAVIEAPPTWRSLDRTPLQFQNRAIKDSDAQTNSPTLSPEQQHKIDDIVVVPDTPEDLHGAPFGEDRAVPPAASHGPAVSGSQRNVHGWCLPDELRRSFASREKEPDCGQCVNNIGISASASTAIGEPSLFKSRRGKCKKLSSAASAPLVTSGTTRKPLSKPKRAARKSYSYAELEENLALSQVPLRDWPDIPDSAPASSLCVDRLSDGCQQAAPLTDKKSSAEQPRSRALPQEQCWEGSGGEREEEVPLSQLQLCVRASRLQSARAPSDGAGEASRNPTLGSADQESPIFLSQLPLEERVRQNVLAHDSLANPNSLVEPKNLVRRDRLETPISLGYSDRPVEINSSENPRNSKSQDSLEKADSLDKDTARVRWLSPSRNVFLDSRHDGGPGVSEQNRLVLEPEDALLCSQMTLAELEALMQNPSQPTALAAAEAAPGLPSLSQQPLSERLHRESAEHSQEAAVSLSQQPLAQRLESESAPANPQAPPTATREDPDGFCFGSYQGAEEARRAQHCSSSLPMLQLRPRNRSLGSCEPNIGARQDQQSLGVLGTVTDTEFKVDGHTQFVVGVPGASHTADAAVLGIAGQPLEKSTVLEDQQDQFCRTSSPEAFQELRLAVSGHPGPQGELPLVEAQSPALFQQPAEDSQNCGHDATSSAKEEERCSEQNEEPQKCSAVERAAAIEQVQQPSDDHLKGGGHSGIALDTSGGRSAQQQPPKKVEVATRSSAPGFRRVNRIHHEPKQAKTWGFASRLKAAKQRSGQIASLNQSSAIQNVLPAGIMTAQTPENGPATEAVSLQETDGPATSPLKESGSTTCQAQPLTVKQSQLLSLRDKLVNTLAHKSAPERSKPTELDINIPGDSIAVVQQEAAARHAETGSAMSHGNADKLDLDRAAAMSHAASPLGEQRNSLILQRAGGEPDTFETPLAKVKRRRHMLASTPHISAAQGMHPSLTDGEQELPSSIPIFRRPKKRVSPTPEDTPTPLMKATEERRRQLKRLKSNIHGENDDLSREAEPPVRMQARRAGGAFLDIEAGLSGSDSEGSSQEEDEDEQYESDFVSLGPSQAEMPCRKDMLMYQRSVAMANFNTPLLHGRRQELDILPDTPMPSQQYTDGAREEEGCSDDDSFIDRDDDEGQHDHLLRSTLKDSKHNIYCEVCRGPGELLCCSGCPMAFHPVCLRLSLDCIGARWFCPVCSDI